MSTNLPHYYTLDPDEECYQTNDAYQNDDEDLGQSNPNFGLEEQYTEVADSLEKRHKYKDYYEKVGSKTQTASDKAVNQLKRRNKSETFSKPVKKDSMKLSSCQRIEKKTSKRRKRNNLENLKFKENNYVRIGGELLESSEKRTILTLSSNTLSQSDYYSTF